jgi:hypothetical protein
MNNKKTYGQFYTTNYNYILQGLSIPQNIKKIIEPFVGNGDLLNILDNSYEIECYDIEPKIEKAVKRDTLLNPPDYINKYVLTNPPYLARNKSDSKTIFDKYNTNDLYKCFLEEIIKNSPLGGIIIIPLNFWCSIRISDIDLRRRFLSKFLVLKLNIFEENVFNDTSYSVCAFKFELRENNINEINIIVYPNELTIKIELNETNKYMIGGEIYNLTKSKEIKIDRLTKKNIKSKFITNINVKCIDDDSNSKICLIYDENNKIIDETPNLTARSYATLIIEPELSVEKQKDLVKRFNEYLLDKRERYNSLFLTNYRESKDIARKRISFQLVYDIANFLLNN